MFQGWFLLAVSLAYVGVLFCIAWWGDRNALKAPKNVSKPIIYSLSLAVYCTSWTFYGAVGQAAATGWDFLPIYLGPALVVIVFGGFLLRIVRVSKEQNITSIADFIASRYGKTQALAVVVTVIAVIGGLPYIALQLKAIAMGFNLLTADPAVGHSVAAATAPAWNDSALAMALLLALFTMLFGTRQIDATEHHPGLMLAIAFESVVKLLAFLAVGLFVTWGMFDGLASVNPIRVQDARVEQLFSPEHLRISFFTNLMLAMVAMFCLPRQFHTAVVENTHERDVRAARVLFPLYLAAIAFFIAPIAVAGLLTFPDGSVEADTFMLTLPMSAGKESLTLLALLGGFSAATGMVIVATVALSTMVSNDIVMPALLRIKRLRISERRDLGRLLLFIRRGTIVVLMVLAYFYYRLFGAHDSLAAIGLLSFAAVAQFAPAMIAGIYWNRANRVGAIIGLSSGFILWSWTLLLPVVLRGADIGQRLLADGPLGIGWLRPEAFLGLEIADPFTQGVVTALLVNSACLVFFSLRATDRSIDRIQANAFVGGGGGSLGGATSRAGIATIGDFQDLTRRFLGPRRTRQAFAEFETGSGQNLRRHQPANAALVRHTERLLAGAIGASSARIVMTSALTGTGMHFDEVVSLLDETSQKLQFRQELLQAAMENLSEGISVIDSDLRLMAWNSRYLELFDYPDGLISVGRPIEDVLLFNARRGYCGAGDVHAQVAKRMNYLRQGSPHFVERVWPDGTVVEIRGNPMPDGGFVTSFTDITERKRAEEALQEAKENLERRVADRTRELTGLNQELSREIHVRAQIEEALRQAKSEAEQANLSKTRFLAAASHDLLQPLNAARLFVSALGQDSEELPERVRHQVERIDGSLQSAEGLLSALLDISRLDAGALAPSVSEFNIGPMLEALHVEFSVLARDRGLEFHLVNSRASVRSDHKMLRRILQNFLSNAMRYTSRGRVTLGCRHADGKLSIQVWDTGPGIPREQIKEIFLEFRRLDNRDRGGDGRGLGLGLAIADRIARMLDHRIEVRSWPGQGTVFMVDIPLAEQHVDPHGRPNNQRWRPPARLAGLRVLCLDNEGSILQGMRALMTPWGCEVLLARDAEEALRRIGHGSHPPDIILADYHLDEGVNGIDVMETITSCCNTNIPGIVITADHTEAVRRESRSRGYRFLQKPLRPAALRALLNRLATEVAGDL